MTEQNLKNVLMILTNAVKENNFGEDQQKIQNLCDSLKKLQNELPTTAEIDRLEKEINYFEIKYDVFNELSYYFDSLYGEVKCRIHSEEVKKIREENRKKRERK